MKINKEEFNKLSQLDRIEFRQKYELIKEKYKIDIPINFLGIMVIIGFLSINIGLSGYEILGIEFLEEMNNISKIISNFIIIYFVLNIIVGLYDLYKKRKAIKELEEEYFKIEVKNKI